MLSSSIGSATHDMSDDRSELWPPPQLPFQTLAERITEARAAAGLSQGGLAKRVGVTRGAVGQWETGTTEPNDSNLRRIAIETGSSYEWLATGRGEYGGPAYTSGPIPFGGVVEAGVFRAIELEKWESRITLFRPLTSYAEVQQYAWEVRGDSMDLAGINDGMWLIAAKADEFREHYGPIKINSTVIVQRLREGGTERELSVKQYGFPGGVKQPDRRELHPHSTNKAHKSYIIPTAVAEKADIASPSDIQIIGVVLAAIRLFQP
jgi:transcriptional regulator with XRE-family HTH domain